MRSISTLLAVPIMLALLAAPALARVGVAIAPATGSYDVPLDGGNVDFTVYNTGDESAVYSLAASGTSLLSQTRPDSTEIAPGQYATFSVWVEPATALDTSKSYGLSAVAKMASGGNVMVGARSQLDIRFTGTRTRPYPASVGTTEQLPEQQPQQPSERPQQPPLGPTAMATATGPEPATIGLGSIALAVAAAGAAIGGIGYVAYRKFR
jgi:hypothetical protein